MIDENIRLTMEEGIRGKYSSALDLLNFQVNTKKSFTTPPNQKIGIKMDAFGLKHFSEFNVW